MALPPHTPVVLLAAIVGSGVAFLAWLYREAPGARPLVAFMTAASVWALAEGIALASPALSGKVFWTKVAWSASPLVPLAWLATVLAYADHEWRLTYRRFGALLVEPLAFVALVWTNERHGLVWAEFSTDLVDGYVVLTREFGLAFWAHTAYSYALVLVGSAVLVRLTFGSGSQFSRQATALLLAVAVPMVANGLSVFEVVPPQFDLTSLGFVVTGVVVAGAVFRENFLSVAPVTRELGREAVVDEIDDPVLIVDGHDSVVDMNPAAERLFDCTTEAVVGVDLATVSDGLVAAISGVETGQVEFEFASGPGGARYFDVRVSSLRRGYGAVTGRVVSLRDVSDRRQREQRLDVLNRLLRHNLRNEMNVVRGNVELLRRHVDADDPTVEKRLSHVQETVDAVVERSDKVGYLSGAVDAGSVRPVDLATLVADATAALGDDAATLSVDVPEGVTVQGGPAMERAVAELVDNAVEHGSTSRRSQAHDDAVEHGSTSPGSHARQDAGRTSSSEPSVADAPDDAVEGDSESRPDGAESAAVTVSATVADDTVELRVADDGPGIDRQERVVIEEGRETALEHGSGVGLWLVRWVVREHGGTVSFADRDDGTTVVVGLPVVEDERRKTAVAGAESG